MLNMIPNDAECGRPVKTHKIWLIPVLVISMIYMVGSTIFLTAFALSPSEWSHPGAGEFVGVLAIILIVCGLASHMILTYPNEIPVPFDNQEPIELEPIEPEETP